MPGITASNSAANWSFIRSPTRITSSAVMGWPDSPAAMFVTQATPKMRIPICAAAMTSGTRDMPTKSTPIDRRYRISAGVS